MTKKRLMPKIPEAEDIRRKEPKYGVNQKKYYDKHHRVKDLQELELGQVVWITDQRSLWEDKSKACCSSVLLGRNSESYHPTQPFPSSGQLEYDQDATRELPDFPRDSSPVSLSDDMPGTPSLSRSSSTTPSTFNAPRSPEQFYRTRSGRTVRPPDRLDL
ncbi:hypothetical protein AVEN_71837-1 [Araneus ventricosus]|uniref:Uncharacterized protein n=1 Tax=Araneus ventricosus TaxID=182803 RepID=A0A4Y2JBP3_ARAVE|nr:hypothetical protein AVEN_71837-1 [Araneus ventricosus]